MEWSAQSGLPDRPFGSWQDDLAAAFVQLEPHKIVDLPFRGSISSRGAAAIAVSCVDATPHIVARLRSHIAASSADLAFVNLQLQGVSHYTQRGQRQVCGPGDLALLDTSEPFEIANDRDFRTVCFTLPKAILPRAFADQAPLQRLSAARSGRALARTLAGYAELCLAAPPASGMVERNAGPIVDLISQVPLILAGNAPEAIDRPVLLTMMLDHLDDHVTDRAISVRSIAARFRCSDRYVHKLFATTGRSVGDHINQRRLLACARDLLADRPGRTIADIAFSAGFSDISHFNRLFKQAYGMSPRDYRRSKADQKS